MECVRCGGDILVASQLGIHDDCRRIWERHHDNLLGNIFPTIFTNQKELNKALGLAIECYGCYRLAITEDMWLKLPDGMKIDVRAYDSSIKTQLCNNCRVGPTKPAFKKKVRRRRPSASH